MASLQSDSERNLLYSFPLRIFVWKYLQFGGSLIFPLLIEKLVQGNILPFVVCLPLIRISAIRFEYAWAIRSEQLKQLLSKHLLSVAHPDTWNLINGRVQIFITQYYISAVNLGANFLKLLFSGVFLYWQLGFFPLALGLAVGIGIKGLATLASNQIIKAKFTANQIRDEKTELLRTFFERVIDYKVCWLDSWIWNRLRSLSQAYLQSLQLSKRWDSVCVALWQLTDIYMIAAVLLVEGEIFKAEGKNLLTVVLYLRGLMLPLNSMTWCLAGYRQGVQAYRQLMDSIKQKQVSEAGKISVEIKQSDEPELQEQQKQIENLKIIVLPNRVYSIPEQLFRKIDQNSYILANESVWHLPHALSSILLRPQTEILEPDDSQQVHRVLDTCQCLSIPLQNPTSTYSGGERLRLSLARCLYWAQKGAIMAITNELKSLDRGTKELVETAMREYVRQADFRGSVLLVVSNEPNEDTDIRMINGRIVVADLKQKGEVVHQARRSERERSINKEWTQVDFQLDQKEEGDRLVISFRESLILAKNYFNGHLLIHFLFFVAIACLYTLRYAINYVLLQNIYAYLEPQIIRNFLLIYTIFVILRSYLFAEAHIKSATQLTKKLDHAVTMSEITSYQLANPSLKAAQPSKQARQSIPSSSKSIILSNQTLLCRATLEQSEISDSFPFSFNIFCNDIFDFIASSIVILLELPIMNIFCIGFIVYVYQSFIQTFSQFQLENSFQQKEATQACCLAINNYIGGYSTLKVKRVDRTGIFFDRCIETLLKKRKLREKLEKEKFNMMLQFEVIIVTFLFLGIGVKYWMNGELGNTAVLISAVLGFADATGYLARGYSELKTYMVTLNRIDEVIKWGVVDRRTKLSANYFRCSDGFKPVSVHNLTFSYYCDTPVTELPSLEGNINYLNEKNNALKNISICLYDSTRAQLKGVSGSGKTTLFRILAGLYPSTCSEPSATISVQHGLLLPQKNLTLRNHVDPYGRLESVDVKSHQFLIRLKEKIDNLEKQIGMQMVDQISEESKILINNYRAALYAYLRREPAIYDEPNYIPLSDLHGWMVVSHQKKFKEANIIYLLNQGYLSEVTHLQGSV